MRHINVAVTSNDNGNFLNFFKLMSQSYAPLWALVFFSDYFGNFFFKICIGLVQDSRESFSHVLIVVFGQFSKKTKIKIKGWASIPLN